MISTQKCFYLNGQIRNIKEGYTMSRESKAVANGASHNLGMENKQSTSNQRQSKKDNETQEDYCICPSCGQRVNRECGTLCIVRIDRCWKEWAYNNLE